MHAHHWLLKYEFISLATMAIQQFFATVWLGSPVKIQSIPQLKSDYLLKLTNLFLQPCLHSIFYTLYSDHSFLRTTLYAALESTMFSFGRLNTSAINTSLWQKVLGVGGVTSLGLQHSAWYSSVQPLQIVVYIIFKGQLVVCILNEPIFNFISSCPVVDTINIT